MERLTPAPAEAREQRDEILTLNKRHKTANRGDIMSYYTNDTDALRQLVSQALPAVINSGVIVLCVFGIMLYYSVWMTLVVLLGVAAMLFVSKKVGGGSAKFFIRQQDSMGKTEGFVQEMMNGQKVIKVFCHEKECEQDFDKINDTLFDDSYKAHAYANTLGPIIMNIGNILYAIIAMVGGISGEKGSYLVGSSKQKKGFKCSWTVGGANSDETFHGIINDWATSGKSYTGTTSITKVGTGLWRLTGANTYSGVTSINGGTLIVNGKNSGKGAMTVADGATLKGKGSITGKVTVYGGGTLCPGDDAVDGSKLTTNGGLALKSGSKLIIPVAEGEDGALILNGISVSGAISIDEGACLEIDLSRLSGHQFKRGDALPIIKDAANITSGAGSFTIYPATPGEGLEWETSTLFTDGMLRVKKEGEIFEGGGITTQHYEATLDHTASVQGGSNKAGKFIDLESHYYNNWGILL